MRSMAKGTWVRKVPSTVSISGRLRLALLAPRISRSWPESRWSSAAVGGEHRHERGRPLAARQGAQRLGERRREVQRAPPAPHPHHRRARPVGGELQGEGEPRQRLAPPGREVGEHLALEPLALPDGEVRIVHGGRRQRRRRGRPRRRRRARPSRPRRSGRRGSRRPGGGPSAGRRGRPRPVADRLARTSGPRSRSKRVATSSSTRRSASGSRRAAGRPERSTTARSCRRAGATRCTGPPAEHRKGGAPGGVAADDLVERRRHHRHREGAAHAARRSDVEPRPVRLELLHEPEALLVEGEGPVPRPARTADPADRRRLVGAGGLALLLPQLLEQLPLLRE